MTDRYAIFGNPVEQSKSPLIHLRFAAAAGQDIAYEKIGPPAEGFGAALAQFIAEGGKGCSVTAPFKLEAFARATHRSDRVQVAGAANTLRFEGGEIFAENTDGLGLVADIERNLGVSLAGKRVLMLGAGGAARGSVLPFLQAGSCALMLLNRTRAKAEAIRDELAPHGVIEVIDYAPRGGYDIVVNATSASLTGVCPPLPEGIFEGCALAYELAYGKGLTPFLRAAQAAGVERLADGVGMLVEQAAVAFDWWRGVRPATAEMIAELRVPLT